MDNLTILVNSCDAYEDLWNPFFSLLKKYWSSLDLPIILNTESKNFSFDGLNIKCVHSKVGLPYGKRIRNALSKVKTKYVLSLLDDFFIRSEVNIERINEILGYMEEDSKIVYFNCDVNKTYAEWEVDNYRGFKRLPPGNDYIFSMQAAIWRTDKLYKLWRPNVSPWEWEVNCNVNSVKYSKYKFYCSTEYQNCFLDYGNEPNVWGVYRGKWVMDDVKPLFEKEGIHVCYSSLGEYIPSDVKNVLPKSQRSGRVARYERVAKYMGWKEVPRYFFYCQLNRKKSKSDNPVQYNYFEYLTEKAKRKFFANEEKNNK